MFDSLSDILRMKCIPVFNIVLTLFLRFRSSLSIYIEFVFGLGNIKNCPYFNN